MRVTRLALKKTVVEGKPVYKTSEPRVSAGYQAGTPPPTASTTLANSACFGTCTYFLRLGIGDKPVLCGKPCYPTLGHPGADHRCLEHIKTIRGTNSGVFPPVLSNASTKKNGRVDVK